MTPTATTPWVIWSYEHDGWWAPNECGYVEFLDEAGHYTETRAKAIEARANYIHVNERAMPLAHAHDFDKLVPPWQS